MMAIKIYKLPDGREVREDELATLPEEEREKAEWVDTEFSFDFGTTRFSVIKITATRCIEAGEYKSDKKVDEWTEDDVKKFLLWWRDLPMWKKILYGLWGEGTPQGRAQKKAREYIKAGMEPEEAVKKAMAEAGL